MPVGTEKKEFGKHGSTDRQLVIFKIAGEEFGVDINEVKEIIRWEDVTRIPNTESYIKGVINLRGSIVVVNDLAMKLGLPSKEVDDDTRILVVEVDGNTVGMVVDSATEVLRLEGEKVQDAPEMITSGIDQNYIDGVGLLDEKRLLTLLDLSKVMVSTDYEKILNAQQKAEQTLKNEKETSKNQENECKKNEKTVQMKSKK
jgi:purine-binding chemotaxis protein CheW